MRIIFVTTIILFFCFGCVKEVEQPNCKSLASALATNDTAAVKREINYFINSLPSKLHTEQNLDLLVQAINKCTITASKVCFGCILTIQSQSEIKLSVINGADTITQIIDISNNEGNEMIFHAMHK
jgi:hypothetical protein